MDNRQPRRADTRTIAISIVGIVVLVVCFIVVLTQDDPTTRTVAIATTIVLWIFLRVSRRGRGGQP
jgi:hypothetical protein